MWLMRMTDAAGCLGPYKHRAGGGSRFIRNVSNRKLHNGMLGALPQ